MTPPKKIPDPEKVKQTVERLRDSNRQLELATLALDELIALVVDTNLRRQRLERLESKYRPTEQSNTTPS